ncbi:hypothetical protein [Weissella viridescens]|uniref:hypothetical protein n=1 Tax=Weissella viridescens TaxID=1629 RepID=UPI003AF295AB
MDDRERFQRAKQFFKNDYVDRGMVKWQGFYLSDHTEQVSQAAISEQNVREQKRMPDMTQEAVSQVLFEAYQQLQLVRYQLKGKSDLGLYSPVVTGRVTGYVADAIYINQETIPLDEIGWCQLMV